MASTITAGNATNSGLIVSPDNTGALEIKTGSGAGTTAISIDSSQNVNFSGTAQRITGDFSNATLANRVAFQTSTVNGATTVNVIPNGTSQISSLVLNSTSTVADASTAQLVVTDTEGSFRSNRNGTGSYLPMTFYTGGSERMRLDTSGNLQFNSGYGSVATVYGCRAWVNFNGTGTVAIRNSGNVSSITDNGTGNYTINFTNAMPDVNYSWVGSCGFGGTSSADGVGITLYGAFATFQLAGSFRTLVTDYGNNTAYDVPYVGISVFR
jgi:hypothetical protein